MDGRRLRQGALVLAVLFLVLIGLVLAGVVPLPVPPPDEDAYTTKHVTVSDANGTRLGRIEARVADTVRKRYTGLSDTASLGDDEGMVFVFERAANRTFVMRDMDFPIDIVFVDATGTITAIHHADVPPPGTSEGDLTRYRGRAKWVLEVNQHWTTDRGIAVGDHVQVGES